MLLIIDTSTKKSLIVMVFTKGFVKKVFGANFDHSEKLLPEIFKLLKNRGLKKVKKIVVISGPGSYTGLRVGIATANALGYALDVPVLGINRLEWLAFQDKNKTKEQICAVLPAIHDQVFASIHKTGKQDRLEQKNSFFYGTVKDLLEEIKTSTFFIVGELKRNNEVIGKNVLKKQLGKKFLGMDFINLFNDKSIKSLIDMSLDKLKNIKKGNLVVPLYIKKPNITLPKK